MSDPINIGISESFMEYLEDWSHREYFVYGGYGSGKSDTTAFKLIKKSFEEERLILVTRKVYGTLEDSCYRLLKKVINRHQMGMFFEFKKSPLYIKNKLTGSEFIFKGLDDKEKLKSLPDVSIVWMEEVSEFSYADYKEIKGRARHPFLSVHWIMTTNPISKSMWMYKHFFENDKINKKHIFFHQSTVDDNPFATDEYIETLDELEFTDPDLYRVARLGEFGTIGVKVLKHIVSMAEKEGMEAISMIKRPLFNAGMDFGYTGSKTALMRTCIDQDKEWLYVYYEFYQNYMTDDIIKDYIQEFKETGELIYADGAEPKTIAYYQQQGFNMWKATEAKKAGSRLQNTKKMQRFKKIIILDNSPNCYIELKDLVFKQDKNDVIIPDQFNIDPHTFSAIWYALEDYQVSNFKVYDF